MKKRILSMILALSMVLSILPVSAFADAGAASAAANKDGETVYDENSVDELYSLYVNGEETKHKEGELIELTAEVQPGYDFVGWQGFMGVPDGVDLTQAAISFNMPAKTVMLVKNYKPKAPEKYTLTVDGDPELHAVGDPIEITAPDKDGFTFNHWEATGLTSDVDINNVTITFNMPANNVTLTPKYDEIVAKKYFVFVDGGETKEYAEGDKVSIPAPKPKKEGYAFTHWESSDVPEGTDTTSDPITFEMPAHEVTLTPKYEMSQYTLTVKGKDGRVEKHAMGELISVSAPSAEAGYTFTGWKVEGQLPDGTDTSSAMFSFRMPANNVTLTPQYAKKYTLTLHGGLTEQHIAGDKVTVEAPELDGYTFTGWETEGLPEGTDITGKTITFEMPANDVKITAKMNKTVTKTLKIDKATVTLQDGSAVANLMAVPVGAKLVAIADADTETSVFKSWSCTGMKLTEEQSAERVLEFTMPDQDVELTAVFGASTTTDPDPDPNPTPDPDPNPNPTPDPDPTPDPNPTPAPSDDGSAAVIVAATAVGGVAVGVGAYMVGTTVYLKSVLPEGVAIPANRQQLAVALWTAAGKPATQSTALFNDVAADAAELQAIRWAVDTGLMTAQDGSFKPVGRVNRIEVIRTWKNYQKRG